MKCGYEASQIPTNRNLHNIAFNSEYEHDKGRGILIDNAKDAPAYYCELSDRENSKSSIAFFNKPFQNNEHLSDIRICSVYKLINFNK